MSTVPPEQMLYDLLPAHFRTCDSAEGYPLRTLLTAIGQQQEEFAADIAHLYGNWFVETCDDDLLGYFGDLVSVSLGPSTTTDAVERRRQVADAVADRRRKGTFSVLAQLASDATGWPAVAQELRALALATPSARFPDIGRRPLLNLGDRDSLEALGTPLSGAAPLPDVRRLSSHRTPGSIDPNGVAVWLWRLVSERHANAPATSLDDEGCFTFDQLGRDLALAVQASPAGSRSPASNLDVPSPITRDALALRVEDYYGPGRSICLYRGGHLIPRREIVVGDLQRWRGRPAPGHVCIDPELGRIAFPARHAPDDAVTVTYTTLGIGAIGGGSYPRGVTPPTPSTFTVGHRTGQHRTLGGALRAWREARKKAPGLAATIEIATDGVYEEHIDIELAAEERLTIRAAAGRRPILIPTEANRGRADRLHVRGPHSLADGASAPEFVLDGVWVAGHALFLTGRFSAVQLRHCTLVPDRRGPSLVVRGAPCPVSIASSVLGRVVVESDEVGFDPIPISVADSVLDAGEHGGYAVLGTDRRAAWTELSLVRCTVLGGAHAHSVGLIEDSILTGVLRCERRQAGAIRFSYVEPRSETPRRTSCQPDDVIAEIDAEIAEGTVPAAERAARVQTASARVRPRFDATWFGAAAYARLASDVAPELERGAHDEGELGAYHQLAQGLRVANLRERLSEFAPVGSDLDIRFAT